MDSAKHYGIINQKELDFMTVTKPVVPTFYLLPKVHKDIHKPPGRPIVSGIGGICENVCTYIDFFLQPLVNQLPSILQDSEHLGLMGDEFLVMCDVESLYTNIMHTQGIFFLDKQEQDDGMHQSFFIDLLDYALNHNYFTFNGCFYKQVSGTAMGACCGPSYANLFLGWWEEVHVYPMGEFQYKIKNWSRFIDDILFVWTGTRDECVNFCLQVKQQFSQYPPDWNNFGLHGWISRSHFLFIESWDHDQLTSKEDSYK